LKWSHDLWWKQVKAELIGQIVDEEMADMNVATEVLTVRLPATAVRRLRRVAEISRRPVDDVVADSLRTSLPPLLEDVPTAFRQDLAVLETLPTAELWQQMRAQIDPERLKRYDELLEVNSAAGLDVAGQRELAAVRAEADRLMFRKAYAAVLLKWRGERVPILTELESER
jgi:hypothetical protein